VVLWAAPFLLLVGIPVAHSQSGNGNIAGQAAARQQPFSMRSDPFPADVYDGQIMHRRMRALNMERQKEMVADASKLLRLARELNAEVASQKSAALTSDQLHKVAEIEKLARNVKERMTSGVGQPQSIMPPMVAFPQN
jgi:hypothetical protein